MRPAFLGSIRFRLVLASSGVIMGIVTALLVYLSSTHMASLNRSLEAKALTYGKLISKQTESAVAFDDRETAREVFEAASQDSDVRSIVVYKANGAALESFGEEIADPPAAGSVDELRVTRVNSAVRATAPVVSKEGPRSQVVIELSTESIAVEKHRVHTIAIVAFLVALVAASLGSWFVGRSLARRLGRLVSATSRVARGDLAAPPVDDRRRDEVGELVTSFNAMQTNLRDLMDRMRRSAEAEQTRLDGLVSQRTHELALRNEEMRLVLDNVSQGFVTIDRDAILAKERSAALDRWLATPSPGASLFEVLARQSPSFAEASEAGWMQVQDGILPIETSIDQMPHDITIGGSEMHLEYIPIGRGDTPDRFLLVATDVSASRARDRAEREQRETMKIFERFLADRSGTDAFFESGSDLVSASTSTALEGDMVCYKRALHTLKGNAGLFGLESIAGICHRLEDHMSEVQTFPLASMRQELAERWAVLMAEKERIVGGRRTTIEIDEATHARLEQATRRKAPHDTLLRMVSDLKLEPTEKRLAGLAEQAKSTAQRLEKGEIDVVIEPNGQRIDVARWAPFWGVFVHALRNAVDHGLEGPEERERAGKALAGRLTLRTFSEGASFHVEIEDDGRGIDWERLASRGRASGIEATTQDELEALLFVDGVSTAESVTEISGRGVGLGALREVTEALGGRIGVRSRRGAGTTMTMTFPQTATLPLRKQPAVAQAA